MITSILKTFIITTVILTIANTVSADGGVCCEGDKICSGCWMCEGSNLRNCWDLATAKPSKCLAKTDPQEKASCYCQAYAAIAKCWGAGTCCTEYSPTLAAATDLCNLATYPSDQIYSWQLDHAISEARRVADAIWHNDSGIDVPRCVSTIKPYSGPSSTGSTSSSAPPTSTQPKYTPPSTTQPKEAPPSTTTGTVKVNPAPPSTTTGTAKVNPTYTSPKEDDDSSHKDFSKFEQEEIRKENKVEHEKEMAEQEKKQAGLNQKKSGYYQHSQRQKHQAQYYDYQSHKSYSSTDQQNQSSGQKSCEPKSRLRKRATASYTTLNPSIGDLRKLSKRDHKCGIDFLGVKYPLEVAEAVQKAFEEL